MVRDPHFWKRFSVAVHQDDLEKTAHTQDPKQSYVRSPLSSPPPGTPTSQTHLHQRNTTFPPMAQLQSTRSSFAAPSPLSAQISTSQDFEPCDDERDKGKAKTTTQGPQRTRSKLQKTPSTKPLLRPTISIQQDLNTSPMTFISSTTHDPQLPPPPSSHPASRPPSLFFRTPNLSTLSLSLSGRPSSRFHFCTTITADASHRDSWLAGQQRKAGQRTWICWCFWIGLLGVVAGVVVAILVLSREGVI